MEMTKKKVFVAALAVCLVAILSLGTLAWFNATDSVENKFMVADSDNNGQPDFSVDVYETDDEGNELPGGKEYSNVKPNDVLAKDPTVKNTGDYNMYTRVTVTLSDAKVWMDASAKYSIADDDKLILESLIDLSNNWVRYTDAQYDATADTLTYVYYYDSVVAPEGITAPVFTKVTIPSALQQADMNYGESFTINVKADAIQADNIIPEGSTLTQNDSFKAFATAGWNELSAYPQP